MDSMEVGGLLNISSFFASMETYSGDFDNVNSGIYSIPTSDNGNQPVERYGVLVAFMNKDTYCLQLFVALEECNVLYLRVRDTKTYGWKPWYYLRFTNIGG